MSRVLSMSHTEFNALPVNEQQDLRLGASMAADITDELMLRKRIREYIYVNSLNNIPVTLADINRRFSRPAKKFNLNTTDIVRELLRIDDVCMLERRGRSAVFASNIYRQIEAARIEYGVEGDLPLTLIEGMLMYHGQ